MKVFIILAFCAVAWGRDLPSSRILGGAEVPIEDYPWQASVRAWDQHRCGGAIIDENTVLTTASCLLPWPLDKFSIRSGAISHQAGKSIKVNEIRFHENYDPETLDNDIAVLKLNYSMILSPRLQPVELEDENVEVPAGTTAWASGFGVKRADDTISEVSSRIRAVDVKVISEETCAKIYSDRSVTSQMLCAQANRVGPCTGDYGGPLVASGKLIGLASWQIGCGRPQYAGVYTKISSLNDWIQKNRN